MKACSLDILVSIYNSKLMAWIGYFEIFLAIVCFLFVCSPRNSNGLPWNWPLVGMLPGIFLHVHRIHDRCTEVLEQTGGTFLLKGPWFANMDILGTVDPANVHYVMSANFRNYPKGEDYKKTFDILGDGIFNSDFDLWKNLRKLSSALINHPRFHKFMVKTSWEKVEKGLIPILECTARDGRALDLQNLFQRYAFDVACVIITGHDPGCLSMEFPEVPFSKALDDAEEALFMRSCLPSLCKLQKWLGIGVEKKLSKAWVILDQIIGNYISMRREELSSIAKSRGDYQEPFDLLSSYISEDQETVGLKRDDKFLRDNILNLMVAARDSTGSSVTWFLWLVTMHQEVENKIRNELKAITPAKESEKPRLFKVEELQNLVYLHAALCESLRLYPPVPFLHKEPLQADILPSGHHVHPKTKIKFPLYAMGRMPSIWGKDCFEFKPERWISENGTIKHEPSYKFLAFNAGPRTCLGKEVAFTQMKAVAAAVIHNYKVQMVEGHQVLPNVSVILYMKHGLKVRITKRWT